MKGAVMKGRGFNDWLKKILVLNMLMLKCSIYNDAVELLWQDECLCLDSVQKKVFNSEQVKNSSFSRIY